MVFNKIITIEWDGLGQPLVSMVFWWFWGLTTIGNNGFQWLSTIGPTIEWLATIVDILSSPVIKAPKKIGSAQSN